MCNIIYSGFLRVVGAGLLRSPPRSPKYSKGLYMGKDCYVVNNRYARVYKGGRNVYYEDRRELW